jgi:hypothetical protein
VSYAKSLRVIGQILEAAQVTTSKLKKHSELYHLWLGKNVFRFDPADIARLDALAQKRRRNFPGTATRPPESLSQQLRTLGSQLDRIDVRAFRIVWTESFAILEYKYINGERKRRVFTAEELWQLGSRRSSRRSNRYLFPQLDI